VDGNDVLSVYEVTRQALERARRGGGPTLIEADTMRMRGHAEHDDMKYVPASLLEEWSRKDPIARFEAHLLERGLATQDELSGVSRALEESLAKDLAAAEASPMPDPGSGLSGVYGDRPVPSPTPALVIERRRGER
jgi:TPP-dependent pyruvate/acetoin dehydrogenase alpha subunit